MKQRNSAFELLRITSMVLIIAHHFSVHGGFYFQNTSLTENMLFLQLLSIGGKVGVNLFVMVTGYFTILSDGWRPEKIVKLWLQIFFYSTVIYLLSSAAGLTAFTLTGLLASCLPVLTKQWWFASAWFVLYLLSPWLNRLLRKFTRIQYRNVLVTAGIFWCLIPVLTWLPERIRDVLWFVYLYALAGWLRLYPPAWKRPMAGGIVCFLLTFCHSVVHLFFRTRWGGTYETVYYNMYHILILVTSLLLFQGFAGLELPFCRGINALAELSFGVYLIHDSDHLRYFLWQDLAKSASFQDSPWLIPYGLLLTAGVYLVCGSLERIRQNWLDRPFTTLSKKLTHK